MSDVYERVTLDDMLLIRNSYMDSLPDDCSGEEREIAWIAQDVCKARKADKRATERLAARVDKPIEELLKWKAGYVREYSERLKAKKLLPAKDDITRKLAEVVNLIESIDDLIPSSLLFIKKLKQIENHVRECVDFFTDGSSQAIGNYRTNRAFYINAYWLALHQLGFSMRAAARILAAAFERAGLEKGDRKKREESIYQVFRDHKAHKDRSR